MSRRHGRRLALRAPTAWPGRVGAIVLTASLPAWACAHPAPEALLVSVAVSLAPAIGELAEAFEAEHPGTTIQVNAGASGILMQQIRRGAPVDLFISASPVEMDRLAGEGLIDRDTVAVLASNRLVLVTRAGTDRHAGGPMRLDRFASIAVANPRTAPLGRYTRQALEAVGAWDTLGERVVLGENARQVIEYVARGEVEAGIVYLSDATTFEGRVESGLALDPATHQPIGYFAGIPREAPHGDGAAVFLNYLRSDTSASVLTRHGFAEAWK